MDEERLKRKEEESELGYVKRIVYGKLKDKTLNDYDYTELSELIFNKAYSSDVARRMFYGARIIFELMDNEEINNLPKNKIDEIMEVIGELDTKKILVRNDTNKLNKIKRDLVKNVEIANYINEYIEREKYNFKLLSYNRVQEDSEKTLIVGISDWHIGYCIKDYKGNNYNYKIAQIRLKKLLSEIEKEIYKNKIKKVVVVQAGDITEGTYMRKNQSYDCEFNSNEQIVMAEELLYGFIESISAMNVNVDVYSVGGNHQRGNGEKDANIESDNNNYVIVKNLRKLFKVAKNERVNICDIDFKEDKAEFDLGFGTILVKHGDKSPKDDKKLYDSECSMNNTKYVLIIKGHYHNFAVTSQNNGSKVVTIGCLFGYNPYSVNTLQCTTHASQCLIITNTEGIEYIRDINLQLN